MNFYLFVILMPGYSSLTNYDLNSKLKICYSGHDLNIERIVCYSSHDLFNEPFIERIILDNLNTKLVCCSDLHCSNKTRKTIKQENSCGRGRDKSFLMTEGKRFGAIYGIGNPQKQCNSKYKKQIHWLSFTFSSTSQLYFCYYVFAKYATLIDFLFELLPLFFSS